MPSPSTTDLPRPKSWDEFEDICADLLKRVWRDPYVTRNGRSGQRQHGVDIYGYPVHLKGQGSGLAGAQCKRVEALSEKDVSEEVQDASTFKPLLEEYVILTTLPRDAAIQQFVRAGKWPVAHVKILFWEDICLAVCEYDELLKKHFPGWFKAKTGKDDVLQLLKESVPDDFEYDDAIGQYLHKADLALRLHLKRDDEMREFAEPWVTKYPDPRAYQQEIYLEYNGTRVVTFWFADVDGGRYLIPYPRSSNDLTISSFQYHIATIVNQHTPGYGIDTGLQRAGITIREGD